MPTISFNGTVRSVPPETTVIDLVAGATRRSLAVNGTPHDGGRLGVAVAVDAVVVPRSLWSRTPVAEGQNVEIVTAIQGG